MQKGLYRKIQSFFMYFYVSLFHPVVAAVGAAQADLGTVEDADVILLMLYDYRDRRHARMDASSTLPAVMPK